MKKLIALFFLVFAISFIAMGCKNEPAVDAQAPAATEEAAPAPAAEAQK